MSLSFLFPRNSQLFYFFYSWESQKFAYLNSSLDGNNWPISGLIYKEYLTIMLQIGGGAALILGSQTRAMALMLAGMTIVINLFMHDFWNVYEGLSQAHETQNFVKNLAIMAGLLALAAGPSAQALSLDRRLNRTTA